jgi:hypothetical protein
MTTLRKDGAPMRTPLELMEFIDTLIDACDWPTVSSDDLREVRQLLQALPARAAMRMRYEASMLAMGDQEALRRGGHRDIAKTRLMIAESLHAIDVDAVVGHAVGIPVVVAPTEAEAFEAAANDSFISVKRFPDGQYMTDRARSAQAIWRAAVRWARSQ